MSQASRGAVHSTTSARVCTIVLDRPAKRNALDQAMWLALRDRLEDARTDPGVSVVVLTGAGAAFTAGQDLQEISDPTALSEDVPGFVQLMEVLERFDKPLMAAVNGVGVGFGLTVLLHCDLVLVAEEARVRAPFLSLGVTTEAAASVLLPSVVGWQRAANLLFTELWLSGPELVEYGIALRCLPGDDLLAEATTLAREIAAMPLASIVETKRLLLAGRADAVRAATVRELAAFERLVGDALSSRRAH